MSEKGVGELGEGRRLWGDDVEPSRGVKSIVDDERARWTDG